jgi:toxin YoeB
MTSSFPSYSLTTLGPKKPGQVNIQRDPFKGLGKPEPLKYALQGFGSRRVTRDDRLVYRVSGKGKERQLEIIQCRYHY